MIHYNETEKRMVEYSFEGRKGAGNQRVSLALDGSGKRKRPNGLAGDGEHYRRMAIGTWRDYGAYGAGSERDPNTGKRVQFQRVEGKIKGVVKKDGMVQFG